MMINLFSKKIKYLFPGYFALVMATGALSIGSFLLEMPAIAKALVLLNIIFYSILWILTLGRLVFYFPKLKKDLLSHTRGPGFFTLVAGTAMFGSQLIIVLNQDKIAYWLWWFALFLWFIIMYTFFTAVTVRKHKPSIKKGINGAWLIAAVATQSISVLGTLLIPYLDGKQNIMLFFTLCMYLLGCMLYLNIITLIFYRFTFVDFNSDSLTLPYWINMGAVAITTLAGSLLILHSDYWSLLEEITPFLKGFTLFFWITGTWWIPLLFILMIWRYVYQRYPMRYNPQMWGMVFPLSMYAAGTFQLAKALQVSFLFVIPKVMIYIALTVWIFGFLGMVHHIIQTLLKAIHVRKESES